MVKRIFLDSRDWIILARVEAGKEKDPVLKEVYQKIKKLSDSNKAIFPFSVFHLDDIMKNSNKKQRENVINVMIKISKGWVMKPFVLFSDMEIENAALHRCGLESFHDVKTQIIGKGIAYTAGIEYRVTSKNPALQKFLDEREGELRGLMDSVESMAKILKNDDFALDFRKWHKEYLKLAIKLEKNREVRKTWKKSERYDNELRDYFCLVAQFNTILTT